MIVTTQQLVLALDTCDARGSIALVRPDGTVVGGERHPIDTDYSSWLLPAASRLLASTGVSHEVLKGYAVAAGPGSFTGVRVGLTTVKAWSEAFGRPIAAVSRLEAIAASSTGTEPYVAAYFDANRNQLFGGVFAREASGLAALSQEMVGPPTAFLASVTQAAGDQRVAWISLDPHVLPQAPEWASRAAQGESICLAEPFLAPSIGLLGHHTLDLGQSVDPLRLDANYVRRSDAELFAKKSAAT